MTTRRGAGGVRHQCACPAYWRTSFYQSSTSGQPSRGLPSRSSWLANRSSRAVRLRQATADHVRT
jgi:hypothetical protein